MPEPEEPKQVSNNDLRNAQFGGGLINAETVNAQRIGGDIDIAEDWVNTHQILPMLDGLDELESNRQELCVQAINQLLQSETRPQYLIVCSRNEEYTKYETCLLLNGAIYLKSLTENQIRQYLTDVKQEKLWHFITNEPHLFELTKIPLFLSIFILAYQEIFRNSWETMTEKRWHNISAEDEEWGQIPSANSFTLQNLLDTYVQQMFTRELLNTPYTKHKQPSARQTRRWLIWLAKQLERESQTEFFLESIQPAWLQSNVQKWLYRVVFTLNAVLISGTIGGVAGSLMFGVNNGLSIGFICAFIFALNIIFSTSASRVSRANPSKIRTTRDIIFNWILERLEINIFYIDQPINPVEEFRLSWERIRRVVITNLPRVFASWIFITLFYRFQLIYGLMICGFFILVWSLQTGAGLFDKPDIEKRINFNQGVQKSIITASRLGLLMSFALVVAFWINKIWKTNIITTGGLVYCLILTVAIWQGAGGLFCLQHFTLRLILYRNRYIPWNYARFLDYCTELGFLQRVGGRYRFIHKLLQDHFAQMEFSRKQK
jgi:hypothetical protein